MRQSYLPALLIRIGEPATAVERLYCSLARARLHFPSFDGKDAGRRGGGRSVRSSPEEPERKTRMFLSSSLTASIVLLVGWVLGWLAFHIAGGLIHTLLIVVVISLIVHFARGRP